MYKIVPKQNQTNITSPSSDRTPVSLMVKSSRTQEG